MSVLIQKNGAFISFLEGGVVRTTLKENCTMNLSNKRQSIKIIDSDGKEFVLYVAQVAATQIAPAAAVPFTGDLVDLWLLLNLSFFNELHKTAAAGTITSDDVINNSAVAGANVTEALDALDAKYIFPKFEMSGVWNISGVISPPLMGAIENDYSPAGFVDNSILRLQANSPRTIITGFAAPLGGEQPVKILHNISNKQIRLAPNSILSSANNRIEISANLNINELETCFVWYDQISFKWKVLTGF
jgi:hypothetical protein